MYCTACEADSFLVAEARRQRLAGAVHVLIATDDIDVQARPCGSAWSSRDSLQAGPQAGLLDVAMERQSAVSMTGRLYDTAVEGQAVVRLVTWTWAAHDHLMCGHLGVPRDAADQLMCRVWCRVCV